MQRLTTLLNDHGIEATPTILVPDLPEPIFYISVVGTQTLSVWRTLRERTHETGYWPIIFGDEEEVQIFRSWIPEDMRQQPPPRTQITNSQTLHPQQALQQALHFNFGDDEDGEIADYLASLHGEWPDQSEPLTTFSILYQPIEHTLYPDIALGLVPTTVSWQLPAFMYYGNWNACPPPEQHCAILRYWEAVYGAEIVGMAHDTLELQVRQPPRTRDAALTLAQEHFAYCPDTVEQGVETLSALAAQLLNSTIWSFWWD